MKMIGTTFHLCQFDCLLGNGFKSEREHIGLGLNILAGYNVDTDYDNDVVVVVFECGSLIGF